MDPIESNSRRTLVVRHLGLVEYEDGLALMQAVAKAREEGRIEDTLLLLEHPPVLTMGRAARRENVLLGPDELGDRGVDLFETDRGGDVTYHGPGQLVGYPIFDLKPDRKDVRKYVQGLEEAIIRTLASYGIEAGRAPKWTGVWVGDPEDPGAVKVCAIGVHIRKWITTHGFALNVHPDLGHFGMIVPCGIQERGVGSMAGLLARRLGLPEVARVVSEKMGEVFGWDLEERDFDLRTISVAVLRQGEGGPEALLLERLQERGGFRQIVTGKIRQGESPSEAARRELFEETGLRLDVADLGYVHGFGMGEGPLFVQEHAFAAWAPRDAPIRIDPAEHVRAEWVSLERAREEVPFRGLRRALELASSFDSPRAGR